MPFKGQIFNALNRFVIGTVVYTKGAVSRVTITPGATSPTAPNTQEGEYLLAFLMATRTATTSAGATAPPTPTQTDWTTLLDVASGPIGSGSSWANMRCMVLGLRRGSSAPPTVNGINNSGSGAAHVRIGQIVALRRVNSDVTLDIKSVNIGTFVNNFNTNDPAAQTIDNSYTSASDLVAFFSFCTTSAAANIVGSLTSDGSDLTDSSTALSYETKVAVHYGNAPSTSIADMPDRGLINFVSGVAIRFNL